MENATHSSKRTSAATAGGYRSKAMYDDVFGGPPRLHGGPPALSPRVEDYKEIFGGFHAPSSSRASIPVLNLPSSSYEDLDARAPTTPLEYADVFGGFGDADFAVSYDELVRMMDNGRGGFSSGEDDDDEDDAWTMSEGEYLSEESNVKNRRLSDGDSCESANGSTEFIISYHKAGRSSADLLNGITHVSQIPSGPEYSCVVDRSSSFSNTDDDYLPYKVNNGHLNADFSGEIVGGRLHRKAMSHPTNGDGIGSVIGDDVSSYMGYVRNGSFPNEPFVTITDVSLRTQPSDLPPPRRPPPSLDVQKINLDSLQAEHESFDYEGEDGDGSLPYFDVVVDAGSAADTSTAAIKEAMEKAQAKLKSAKERMEKKKGVEQTHTKTISMKNSMDMEERVTQLLDESCTRRDERLQSSPRGQDFVVELPVSQGKLKTRQAPHALLDSVDGKNDPTLTSKYSEEKHGRESLSSEGSAGIDGDDEWKEANQYYELVKPEKLLRPFNQANSANIMGKTVNDFRLEKKGKSGMDGLEQVDLIMGLTRTRSKLEGYHARPESGKLHQGLEKALSADEDIKWEENVEKLTVGRRPVENDAQDVNENTELLELNGWFQPMKSQSEIKKTVKQKGEGLELAKAVRTKSKQNEDEIEMADEQAENERRVTEAFEQDEKERKIKRKYEQEKTDKKQKSTSRREENENRLKEALQLEGSKRRQKEILEKEVCDRTMKENREKEENVRKQKLAIEKEETEKRERAAHEREENEKRLKETVEKEKERRRQEMVQREEIEKKQREAREKQKLEKRLEREKKEQIIQENVAREENDKKQREYQERKEREKRMRETFEREENERRLNQNEREEPVKRWQEATEKEEVKERVEQHKLSKEIGGREEEGLEKEENGRPLKAAKNGIVDLEEKETCNQEETANKMHEMHESEVTDGSEKVMLNGQSQVQLNHNASPSESMYDGTYSPRNSRLPVKQKIIIAEVETRPANDRNVGIQAEPRDTQRGSTLGRPELLNNTKSTDILGRIAESGGRSLSSEDYPAENHKKAGKFSEVTEQLKLDGSRSASSSDANVGNLAMKAGRGRNEERENLEHSQVTSNREGITDNFVPSIVVKDEETDKTRRKGALPHLAKVEVEESVQRTVPIAAPEQTVERKVKNLHATMSLVQKETGRVKREKELEQGRLRKLEEEREREREREREKDRMAVDKSTLEARANAEFREKAERAAVERIMNEARERLEKACAEARGKSLADRAPVDSRFRTDRAAAERAAAEARERAYQKAMAERATFDMRDRVESSMPDGPYYMERSGVEGESPQRCKARLERHRRTAERAAKALAEKNMRDLIAQREQAERNRLAETLDADVKRWSSGKEGNLRALISTLQYILGPDSGWQPVPLTEVITAAAVKKAYRKATLCVHPDKLQQRGASIQQKYISEKVFDLLKEAWNRFNSEER